MEKTDIFLDNIGIARQPHTRQAKDQGRIWTEERKSRDRLTLLPKVNSGCHSPKCKRQNCKTPRKDPLQKLYTCPDMTFQIEHQRG